MKTLFIFLCILCLIIPTVIYGIALHKTIKFSANCLDYFKLAADANDTKLAEKYMDLGIMYLEDNNLTKGNTSIFIKKPKNDLEFWYNNLKSAQSQLRQINEKDQLTDLEESNILMKLRESLLDSDGMVIHPANIVHYPNHIIWFWTILLIWLFYIASYVCVCIIEDRYYYL
jgi:hypothetical protein